LDAIVFASFHSDHLSLTQSYRTRETPDQNAPAD
jgi:hypothetical protein